MPTIPPGRRQSVTGSCYPAVPFETRYRRVWIGLSVIVLQPLVEGEGNCGGYVFFPSANKCRAAKFWFPSQNFEGRTDTLDTSKRNEPAAHNLVLCGGRERHSTWDIRPRAGAQRSLAGCSSDPRDLTAAGSRTRRCGACRCSLATRGLPSCAASRRRRFEQLEGGCCAAAQIA